MKFYIPKIVLEWNADDLRLTEHGVKHPDTVGYLPVFPSLQALRQHFPHHDYIEMSWSGKRHAKPFNADSLRPPPEK